MAPLGRKHKLIDKAQFAVAELIIDKKLTATQAAALFGISEATARRYVRKVRKEIENER